MKALAKAVAQLRARAAEAGRLPRAHPARAAEPSALVETLITWRGEDGAETCSTLGVDSDQLAAAVIATEKMLNGWSRSIGLVRDGSRRFVAADGAARCG